MNTLSIILYLADVLQNIQPFFVFSGIVAGGTALLPLIFIGAYNAESREPIGYPKKLIWCMTLLSFLFFTISTLIPTRDTILLIAASEASEMVIKNDEVREVMGDVKEVIQQQLKKLKE